MAVVGDRADIPEFLFWLDGHRIRGEGRRPRKDDRRCRPQQFHTSVLAPGAVIQRLDWGEIRQERTSAPDTMFATTGRRLYVIGDIDGGFRPRSNPYDLHAFGEPQEGDRLAYRLQGVWAQPSGPGLIESEDMGT